MIQRSLADAATEEARDGMRMMLADPRTRDLLRLIIDRSTVLCDPFPLAGPVDPYRLAATAGWQGLGRELLHLISLVDQDAYAKMMNDLLAEEADLEYAALKAATDSP
jgi:hypothetical protein